METVTLTYKRPPNRVNHFQQELLYLDEDGYCYLSTGEAIFTYRAER